MTRARRPWVGSWLAALFVTTGGFGGCVPGIRGLGHCEFAGDRLLWALLIWLALLPCVALARAGTAKRRLALSVALLWPLSVALNVFLDQDPLVAALNWEIEFMDLEDTQSYRDWEIVTSIENHEQVCYDAIGQVFYVGRGD